MKKLKRRFFSLLALTLCLQLSLFADIALQERSKVDKQTFKVDPSASMKITNNHGPIDVRSTDSQEATVEAVIIVSGDSDAEIQKVLDRFTLNVNNNSGFINVEPSFDYEYWKKVKSWLRDLNEIKFTDGTTAQDINDIEIQMIVYQPKVRELSLETKCNDISFDEIRNDVKVKLFSADFKGGNIDGDLDLNLKYGEAQIGDFKSGRITIFDGEFTGLDAVDVIFDSKYSELEIKNIKSLNMESFDDNVKVGNINDECDIRAKYSDFEMSNFNKTDFDFFECDLTGGNGSQLEIDSKYSDFQLGNFSTLEFEGFEDDLDIGNLQVFKTKEAKYCDIDIELIEKRLSVSSSFEGDFKVDRISESFESISVEGKYTEYFLPLPKGTPYFLNARLQYGDLYFEGDCNGDQSQRSGSDVVEMDCEVNNPNSKSATVNIASFDSDVHLK